MTPARSGLTPEQKILLAQSTVVPRLVKRMAPTSKVLTKKELRSTGDEAEFRAATRFVESLGTPFEAFTYGPVHKQMRREIRVANQTSAREQTGHFGPSYEYLERAEDTGNSLMESDEASRRGLEAHYAGIVGTTIMRFLSSASVAPTEDELQEHADRPRRRSMLLAALDAMGREGEVLRLKYFEGLEWKDVASRLGINQKAAQRDHDRAIDRLVLRLAKRLR